MSGINLRRNIALSSVSKVLTIVAAFVTNWFLARYLGPELRGKYVYLFTLNAVIWMFLDLGVHKSFPYLLQNRKVSLRALYRLTVLTFVAELALVAGLYLLAGRYFAGLLHGDYPRYVILALGVYLVCHQFYMRTQFLQLGSDQVRAYSLMAFLPTFVFMLLVIPLFWLMPAGQRMEYSFVLNVLVFVIVLLVMQIRFRRGLAGDARLSWPLVGESYKLGLRAFASEYLIILLMRLDLLILKALGSYAQVGIYTLAVNFVDIINMSCSTIATVLLVKLASLKDELSALIIMRRILFFIVVVDLVAVLLMVVFGRWFITRLYGPAYVDAYNAFLLLIPAVFGITLGSLFNTFIWSKGFPAISIIAPVAPLLVKLGLNYLLVPRYGLFGTSIASSICYPLWFVILLAWYFIRHPQMRPGQLIPRREDWMELRRSVTDGMAWLKNRLQPGRAA